MTTSARLIARLSLALLSGAFMVVAGTESASAALSNTLTWTGTTNTNVNSSNNWTASPAYGATGFNLSNTIYAYVYTNNYSAVGQQTFSYANSNAGSYGVTFGGYTNVLVTNVGTFRLDTGGLTATKRVGYWHRDHLEHKYLTANRPNHFSG